MDNLILDLQELKRFYDQSLRSNVKDSLLDLIKKLEASISALKEKESQTCDTKRTIDIPSNKPQLCTLKISTYAWDQSEKFFKIIVTNHMDGIQSHPDDKISSIFTENSFKVTIHEFNNSNFELSINHLYGSIVPSDSFVKKKSNSIVIMLKKAVSSQWSHLSKRNEKQEIKTPKLDKDKDPNESLMDMMKQMYEDGDDDMKRTIAKAWSESRNKNSPL